MQRPTLSIIATICVLLAAGNSFAADTLTESFDSRSQRESGNLIWNQALGIAHPRVLILGWDDGGGVTNSVFEVGDGSHGPFQRSTYTVFDPTANDTDKIVRINTDTYPILNFTKFELDAGWKIIPTGSKPLTIYSLSTVIIHGEIHCQGSNGQAPTGAGRLTPGLGGTSRCGGGAGGNGGERHTGVPAVASGVAGFSPNGNITGGNPGTVTVAVTTGSGGGGGGAFSDEPVPTSGRNGAGGNAIGGSAGTNFIDHAFTEIAGAAGGGGGSGSSAEAGAGGGAGGGAVIIHAVGDITLGTNGFIFAQGGNGANTAGNGGAGGAGGGGSIQIFTAGNFLMQAAAGVPVDARKGTPGQSLGSAGTDGDGGIAYTGRTWISVGTYDPANTASYLPSEDPAMTVGDGRYEVAIQNVVSKSFDTQSTLPEFASIAATSAVPAQVSLEVSGSSDNFVSDDSGWLPSAQLTDLNNKRYIKFRLSIDNNNATVPVNVSAVTVNYAKGMMKDFEFKGGGCGLVKGTRTGAPQWIYLVLLLIPLVIFRNLRRRI